MRVEARVVRVQEFAGDPAFALLLPRSFMPSLSTCSRHCGVFAEMRDDLVVLAEQRDARAEVGHEQHVAARVDVRGQDEAVERLEVFAFEREPLQPLVRAVGDDDATARGPGACRSRSRAAC